MIGINQLRAEILAKTEYKSSKEAVLNEESYILF